MSEQWNEMQLGDVLELKRGYDLPHQHRQPGSVPVVSSSGPTGFHDEAKVRAPGVVTGRYGTIGQVFVVTQDFWPLNTTLYVRDFKGNDPMFVGYLLRTVDFLSCSDKAAVPGVNRNHLHLLKVTLPGPTTQRAIAAVLVALDDKIELNRRTNATLEAMARALFKSWFVDFDPVRAKKAGRTPEGMDAATVALFPDDFDNAVLAMPKGWTTRPLYDAAQWVNGAAYRDFEFSAGREGLPIVKIAELKAGITEQTRFTLNNPGERYRLANGDILFSWSGNPDTSIDTFCWLNGAAWLNQHIFKVIPPSAEERTFLLCLLRELRPMFAEIARDKQTTGLGHVTAGDMKRLQVVEPSRAILAAFDRTVGPLVRSVDSRRMQSSQLGALRDALLPKLLSGELRIPEAERIVGKAV